MQEIIKDLKNDFSVDLKAIGKELAVDIIQLNRKIEKQSTEFTKKIDNI